MASRSTQMIVAVGNRGLGLVLKIRCLRPKQRYTSTRLNERCLVAVVLNDLLRFNEVRAESLLVDSSAEQASASPLVGAPRNEYPRELVAVHVDLVD